MAPEDVELFESLAADALEEFGFELRHNRFSTEIIREAERFKLWWEENFVAKQSRNKFVVANSTPSPTEVP